MKSRWIISAGIVAAVSLTLALQTAADQFKLDLGECQNTTEGTTLSDWDTIGTFALDTNGVYQLNLHDFDPFSSKRNTNVVLRITDNAALTASQSLNPPIGMTCNNPTHEGVDVAYDGILVPHIVKDDYLYRNPCPSGTEMLFRFANLNPGTYHVTAFLGRTTDNGQFAKVWVDDATGGKEPSDQNTGDFSGTHLSDPTDPTSTRVVDPQGNPKTVTVTLKAGDYLWFAHMEDASGGTSGIIIRNWQDTDSDGIPDDWETHYGLNPNDPSDAAKDCNNDGITNLQAYQMGLDPCDATPPTVLSATGSGNLATVKLAFSEPLDPTGATNSANFTITPNLAVTAANYGANVVTLTTATQTLNTAYTVAIKGLTDLSKNKLAAGTTASFKSYVLGTNGVLKFSYWGDATGGDAISGADVGSLLSDPRYPNSPSLILPVYSFNSRDAFTDDSHDNYGDTIEGLLTPTDTAQYTFLLRSDDASQLWLSTDATPANLTKIAEETGCCQAFLEPDPNQGAAWHDNGDGMGQTTLTPISLTAGKSSFIRTIHKEGGGTTITQVAWRKAGDTSPSNMLSPIPGQFLSSTVALPIPPATAAAGGGGASLSISRSGNNLTISWPSTVTGATLQNTASLTSPVTWKPVSGVANNSVTIPIGPGTSFYRLSQ